MQEVRIHKFKTHYRLPPRELYAQTRLDQIRAMVLARAFEHAFQSAGVAGDAELCIRKLSTPVFLRLGGSDESIIADWSRALAAEILRALRSGPTSNVVFYHSRRQAQMDLAIGVSCGDLSRVWAWRQLGLWRTSYVANQSDAIPELVQTLCAEPLIVVPTLLALVDGGNLERLITLLSDEQWESLACAALSQFPAASLLVEPDQPQVPSPRAVRDALRVLKASRLLPTITLSRSLSEAGGTACRAVATLAVLETEPALLRVNYAQNLINIIAEAVRSARDERINELTAPVEPLAVELSAHSVTGPPESKATQPSHLEAKSRASSDLLDAETKPRDLRRRALTRFGGLLLLLRVMEDLGLPETILAEPALSTRPFVWVIHQLALVLVTIEPNDPGALAFVGLPPNADPPSEDQDDPNETEASAIKVLAARIVERLRLLLDREVYEPQMDLLEFVCRRRAEIVADPGWIDVKFSFDEISTDIRRAGLDLDPGYLPWLGVVVRFIYE